jgi:uncharacterized protein (UPF0297 family)
MNGDIACGGQYCIIFHISQDIAEQYTHCHAHADSGISTAGYGSSNHISRYIITGRYIYIPSTDNHRILADKGAGGILGIITGLGRTHGACVGQITIGLFISLEFCAGLIAIFVFFIKGVIPVTRLAIKDYLGFPYRIAVLIEYRVAVAISFLYFVAVGIIDIFFMADGIITDPAAVTLQ